MLFAVTSERLVYIAEMEKPWNGIKAILLLGLLKVASGSHDTNTLLLNLLKNYHADVPPTDYRQPVTVGIGLKLVSFHFIDEATGLMSFHAWLNLVWSDSRLKWDPTAYGNISILRVDQSDLWQPDIELYNGIKVNKLMDNKALLYNVGLIYSLPSYRIEAKCEMNLRYFPYDQQKCTLRYGPWAHDASIIRMTATGANIETTQLHPSYDFVLLNTSQKMLNITYPCCPDETYGECLFILNLKRSSGAYNAKLILPSVLSGLMVLATFLLPPASHEKITLCGITFLALLLLLVYLQSIVPASGDTIIGEYLAFALCIDFFATILAVVSYVLHGRESQSVRSEVEGDNQDLKIQNPPITKTAWFRYLDLASFVIFSLVFVIGAAIMLGRQG